MKKLILITITFFLFLNFSFANITFHLGNLGNNDSVLLVKKNDSIFEIKIIQKKSNNLFQNEIKKNEIKECKDLIKDYYFLFIVVFFLFGIVAFFGGEEEFIKKIKYILSFIILILIVLFVFLLYYNNWSF